MAGGGDGWDPGGVAGGGGGWTGGGSGQPGGGPQSGTRPSGPTRPTNCCCCRPRWRTGCQRSIWRGSSTRWWRRSWIWAPSTRATRRRGAGPGPGIWPVGHAAFATCPASPLRSSRAGHLAVALVAPLGIWILRVIQDLVYVEPCLGIGKPAHIPFWSTRGSETGPPFPLKPNAVRRVPDLFVPVRVWQKEFVAARRIVVTRVFQARAIRPPRRVINKHVVVA